MSLQSRILKEYRQHYPQHTLREISLQTGIQLTRVFRLMNGSSMKLEEFESFSQAIGLKSQAEYQGSGFQRCALKAQQILNEIELNKLTEVIERHIHWHALIHGEGSKVAIDQHIA